MARTLSACLTTVLCLLLSACGRGDDRITIDLSAKRQTIQGLGVTATGVWIPEVVALYGQDSFARKIQEDLGASIIRLALPPEIQPNEHLDTSTLALDSFDFTKFEPPAEFLRSIRRRDPSIKVILSIWSPPSWMKSNASTKEGGRLRPDRREHFGRFCAAACLGFEREYGVPIFALSIQNEPYFSETYDSCLYSPEEMRETIDAVAAAFAKWNVTTRLMAPEDHADIPRWFTYVDALGPSARHLGALNVHNEPAPNASRDWTRFHAAAKKAGLPLWMTETSGEDPTWLGTAEKPGALALARKIHDALVHGECEAWVYWAIADPAPSEFALMSLAEATPKYHAARHYFKFIRPGAVRLDVRTDRHSLAISAFHHEEDGTLSIVAINAGDADERVTISLVNAPTVAEFKVIRSSQTQQSAELDPVPVRSGEVRLDFPAHSVTTMIGRTIPNGPQGSR